MMQLPTRIPLLTAALSLSAVWLGAEPSPAVPHDEEILSLDRFVVTDVPVEDSINPLVRPMQSVFGDGRSILETPRAVSTISQALLRERGINGVAEFVAYAPGSYAPASYGKATIPNIRGDLPRRSSMASGSVITTSATRPPLTTSRRWTSCAAPARPSTAPAFSPAAT